MSTLPLTLRRRINARGLRCISTLNRSAPYLLSPAIQTYQIWGANTDVGKTIFSTILCRTAAFEMIDSPAVHYLKPVQTGFPIDSDVRHVTQFAPNVKSASVLHAFENPVSPHRAAIMDNRHLSDKQLLMDVEDKLSQFSMVSSTKSKLVPAWAFVETAGGVLSPTCSGSLQADAYRPLRLPAILIGDPNLGGIATTLSSAEALRLRGYDIDLILMFSGENDNHLILPRHIPRGTHLNTVPAPPAKNPAVEKDVASLEQYYAWLVNSNEETSAREAIALLAETHRQRLAKVHELKRRARDIVWYPFTQHATLGDINVSDDCN